MVASVKSATASNAVIAVAVYDASGAKVFQQFWGSRPFRAGQTRTVRTSWSVPLTATPGTYTVEIGVFSSDFGTLYNWNAAAAVFSVM
jgi:hypothetical protein